MVRFMTFYVDGGCRNNGYSDAYGAACAVYPTRHGYNWYRTADLPRTDHWPGPTPTNQRAEILAIILALEWALEKYRKLSSYPRLVVKIHSDSRYAVGCMSDWIYSWSRNGWRNSRGQRVANLDLIQQASDLDDEVHELGRVEYIWVPRSETLHADELCNEALDEQEYYH